MKLRRTLALTWLGGWDTCEFGMVCGTLQIGLRLHGVVAGGAFEHAIGGGLISRLRPEKLGPDSSLDGWTIELFPQTSPQHDYIYPVNPPIRFNGLQTLGATYGDDATTSLGHPHQMRFLLDANVYERIQPLLTAALWPYNAPHPETAGAEYLGTLKELPTGRADLTVLSYDLEPETDSIRHINIRVTFTVPAGFKFDPHFQPKPVGCPSAN